MEWRMTYDTYIYIYICWENPLFNSLAVWGSLTLIPIKSVMKLSSVGAAFDLAIFDIKYFKVYYLITRLRDILYILNVLLSCFGAQYSICCNLMRQPRAAYRWAKVLNQQVLACSSQKNHTSMRMRHSWSLLIYCARASSCVNKTGYLQIAEGYPSG